MAIGDHATGEMRLETVIDSDSEDFKRAYKKTKDELLRMGITADVEEVILNVVLKCAIERTAWEAFAKTDMKGDGWSWNFYVDFPPVGEAGLYLDVHDKIRIRSTARWVTSDAGEYGVFLTVRIGDFIVSPID